MKVFIFFSILFLLVPQVQASAPQAFEFRAAIRDTIHTQVPHRLTLTHDILALASDGYADLRMFRDDGQETPYVIYQEKQPQQSLVTFEFKIISYNQEGNQEEIILSRPEAIQSYHAITLATPVRDFKKSVEVFASEGQDVWHELLKDTLFDFTSNVDLRKNTIEFAAQGARYLKLVLTDDWAGAKPTDKSLQLSYDGLNLQVGEKQEPKKLKVENIVGRSGEDRPEAPVIDTRLFDLASGTGVTDTRVTGTKDDEGNTVLSLGLVNLPLYKTKFYVENAYYHRRVELWVADVDQADQYHYANAGILYKIPGMNEAVDTIEWNEPARRYIKFKIINKNNPPLKIAKLAWSWMRENLYFIPEPGRGYTLYVGSHLSMDRPEYELPQMITPNFATLATYPQVMLQEVAANPAYDAEYGLDVKKIKSEKNERTVLWVVLGMLVLLIMFWIFSLLQKLPGKK